MFNLDSLWLYIAQGLEWINLTLDRLLYPINTIHPALSISLLALGTVLLAKFFSKHFKTKRYYQLKADFEYWYELRQKAEQEAEDPEKGKHLARNIDQAKLNKVYYDYFFEGLLNNLVTKYLPILCILGYINSAYRPNDLLFFTGSEYLFHLRHISEEGLTISPVLWFISSLILIALSWYLLKRCKVPFFNWFRSKSPVSV